MKKRGSLLTGVALGLSGLLAALVLLWFQYVRLDDGGLTRAQRASYASDRAAQAAEESANNSTEMASFPTEPSESEPDESMDEGPAKPSLSRLEQTAVTQIGELIQLVGESNAKLYEKIGPYDIGSDGKYGLTWNGHKGEGTTSEYDERCFRTCWLSENNQVLGFVWESVEAGLLQDSLWHRRYPHPSAKVLIDSLELNIVGVYAHTLRGSGGPICEISLECHTPKGRWVTLHTFADGQPYEEKIDLRTNAKVPGKLKLSRLASLSVFLASGGKPGTVNLPDIHDRDWTKIELERDN